MFVKSYLSFCVVMFLAQEHLLCPVININTERGADSIGYPQVTTILQSDDIREIFENVTQVLLDKQINRFLENKPGFNIKDIVENVTSALLEKNMHELWSPMDSQEGSGLPRDCQDIRKLPLTPSGVYAICPRKDQGVYVYCDLSNGPWTVIQKRIDGRVNFTRDWASYRAGFGSADHEYWLGNQLIYLLTSSDQYQLRIDMTDSEGQSKHVIYDNFSISDEASGFMLNINGFHGYNDINDDLNYHNGSKFSTIDKDQDLLSGSCSKTYHGGWWYKYCHNVNLNGEYGLKKHGEGLNWYSWTGNFASLSHVEMKVRRFTKDYT